MPTGSAKSPETATLAHSTPSAPELGTTIQIWSEPVRSTNNPETGDYFMPACPSVLALRSSSSTACRNFSRNSSSSSSFWMNGSDRSIAGNLPGDFGCCFFIRFLFIRVIKFGGTLALNVRKSTASPPRSHRHCPAVGREIVGKPSVSHPRPVPLDVNRAGACPTPRLRPLSFAAFARG